MNKDDFLEYLGKNFTLSGVEWRLISNILDYVSKIEYEQQYDALCALLDGTIGLSDREVRMISL